MRHLQGHVLRGREGQEAPVRDCDAEARDAVGRGEVFRVEKAVEAHRVRHVHHLMELNWVRPIGRKKVPGSPIIYGTTDFFLEYFGLEQVSDLPGLEELKASGLLESRLPGNLDIAEPKEVDLS